MCISSVTTQENHSEAGAGGGKHVVSLAGPIGMAVMGTSPDASAAQLPDMSPVAQPIYELADLDAKTAGLLAGVLQPLLSIFILLFIVRIVLSW